MKFDPATNSMVCMLCHKRLDSFKVDTINNPHQRYDQDLNISKCQTTTSFLLLNMTWRNESSKANYKAS